jgi:uncharacterized membrane protein
MNIAEANTAVFDRVLACALGEATEAVRIQTGRLIGAGNPEYVVASQKVSEVLGALPSALTPVVPPAFLKERVMSQIAGSIAPSSEATTASQVLTNAGRMTSTFARLRGSMVFSGLMLIGGIFVSGYAVDQLAQGLNTPRADRQVATNNTVVTPSRLHADYPERQVAVTEPLQAPQSELAPNVARTSEVDGSRTVDGLSGHMQTNFGLTQAYLYLTSDPEALQYSMSPATSQVSGEGRVLWDENHGDALLVVSKLQPTSTSSHYVLWYLRDGVSPERMLSFSAASGTPMQFFVNHAPSDRVTGVKVTIERNVQGRVESQEVLRAQVKERLHS